MRQYIANKVIEGTDIQILTKIKKARGGSLFFVKDFLRFGNYKTISKALERLVEKGEISRVTRGIYARFEKDPILGPVRPGTEAIAKAIAKRDKARIVPTGVLALNALGLSTQMPMNVVYLTDGAARRINIGKRKIIFKKASPRNLAAIGDISGLAIQALKEIGKDDVTENEKRTILEHLKNEDKYRLEHDIRLAPEWIRIIMRQAL
nr:type IV toxin-antitoxin system AbiEi family antitoxin domain-containing protein [Sunxiuqinia sp.]